LNLFIHKS